ncbi:MAG: PQQ-binding-like beta-propeller repeat protein [Bacteroidota bacterium]
MPNHINPIARRLQWYLLSTILFLLACDTQKDFQTWEVYRGDPGSTSYSNLNQINKNNIDQLEVAWEYATGDVEEGSRTSLECNPIIVNGKMYVTSPRMKLICLDAVSGKEIWRFDPYEGKRGGGVNRGVAYWGDKYGGRIFIGAGMDLYCLDAETGSLITEFGGDGKIDLRAGLGRDTSKLFVRITSPGIIYGDLLILGSSVSESYGSAPGFIRAYDVRSGDIAWTFHTIPQPGEYGYDTWEEDNYKEVGGVNAWTGLALDQERGIVYAPTGSASFDFFGGYREGENLFANCLIALNAKTGERIWHYQLVHHDIWDYDLPAPPTLVTINKEGKEIDAVAQITKMGWVFVFDRETGEPVFPIEEVSVPQSGVLAETSWPTQPRPSKPPAFVRQVFDESQFSDISEGSYEYIKDFLKNSKYGPIYTPPSLEGTVQFPGTTGGGEWGGPAFDPESGVLYVNANEVPSFIMLKPINADNQELTGKQLFSLNNCASCHGSDLMGVGAFPSLRPVSISKQEVMSLLQTGKSQMPAFPHLTIEQKEAIIDYVFNPEKYKGEESEEFMKNSRYVHYGNNDLEDQDGYFGVKPPWGTLNAIDLNDGEILWKVPLGIYPELIEKGLPPTGTQNMGGPIVTKGGLVFIGATRDEMFRAFDKRTGDVVWEYKLPFGGHATPSTYEVDGVQYIVIASGGHGGIGIKSGDRYVAFKLKGF